MCSPTPAHQSLLVKNHLFKSNVLTVCISAQLLLGASLVATSPMRYLTQHIGQIQTGPCTACKLIPPPAPGARSMHAHS